MTEEKKFYAAVITDGGKIVVIHFEEATLLQMKNDIARDIYCCDRMQGRTATIFEIEKDDIITSGTVTGGIKNCQILLNCVNGVNL